MKEILALPAKFKNKTSVPVAKVPGSVAVREFSDFYHCKGPSNQIYHYQKVLIFNNNKEELC